MAKQDSPIKPAKSPTPARPRRRTAVANRAEDLARAHEVTEAPTINPSSSASRSDSTSFEPSEEAIRLRAYHRYLARGGGHGMAFDDWLEAERELKGTETRKG